MNIENVFDFIRYACYYYVPDKANMKKIKQLFEAIPFFIAPEYQNNLFEIILRHPIQSYYDTNENMNEYGYLIYRDFHKENNLRVKEYDESIKELKNHYDETKYKTKRNHNFIFWFIVLVLFYYLYKIQ